MEKEKLHIGSILIADDHELILAGIHHILIQSFSIDEISMFTTSKEVLSSIEEKSFELYILDIEMGDVSGFELIRQIRKKNMGAKILICTMHEEVWYVNQLLDMDVTGIMLKKSTLEHLKHAVTAVMSNEKYLCPRFQKISKSLVPKTRFKSKNYQLTPTERIVLKYIVEGYKSREIAEAMFVTEDAIEAHRKNLFLKLNARNVAQLVSIAIRQHLVD